MPVILLHGDNSVELTEAVHAARRPFQSVGVLTLDGRDAPLSALAEACMTAGLFEPERLVIVENLHERYKGTRKEGGDVEEIRKILCSVPPTTTLVLASPGMAADHQLAFNVREAGGEVRSFTMPKKGDLPRWIVAQGKKHRVMVAPDAAELLADMVGANPLMLDNELEKLATYAGDEQLVTPAMVETLVGHVPQDSIFSLVDAIAAGDRAKALRLLHSQLEHATAGPTDFALYLIRMLARQMRILLRIRLGREAGRSTTQITSDLKLPRYYADRYFRQANRLSTERLRHSFDDLAQLEHGLKSGRAEAGVGLDLLVTQLCS